MVRSDENFPPRATFRIAFLIPSSAIPVRSVHPLLRLDIGAKIGQDHIAVALGQQHVDNRSEDARFHHAEAIAIDEVDRPPDLFVAVVDLPWVV